MRLQPLKVPILYWTGNTAGDGGEMPAIQVVLVVSNGLGRSAPAEVSNRY